MMNRNNSNHFPPDPPESGEGLLSHELSDEHDDVLARLQRVLPGSSKGRQSTLGRGDVGQRRHAAG